MKIQVNLTTEAAAILRRKAKQLRAKPVPPRWALDGRYLYCGAHNVGSIHELVQNVGETLIADANLGATFGPVMATAKKYAEARAEYRDYRELRRRKIQARLEADEKAGRKWRVARPEPANVRAKREALANKTAFALEALRIAVLGYFFPAMPFELITENEN